MIQTFRTLSVRRKLVALVLATSLVGTGIASWAAVNDTLTQTNNYSVLSLDLQASNDGTTYAQSITQSWVLEGTTAVQRPIHLKNTGNGTATINFSATATGASSITGASFRVYTVAALSDCPATGNVTNFTLLNNQTTQTVGAASSNTAVTLAPGASVIICERVVPTSAPAASDTATQTVTWSASSSL